MKAVILTEGGKNIGLGHITRCFALAQGIRTYKGIPAEFIINGDIYAEGIFRGQDCKFKIKNWISSYKQLNLKLEKKDLVIIDSYLAPKAVYDFIYDVFSEKGKRPWMISIDDYNRIDYPGGIVINPSSAVKKPDYSLLSRSPGPVYLTGKDYIILRREFWRTPRKYVRKKIKDVLVTFGGTDHSGLVIRIVKLLLTNYKFNLHIICPNEIVSARYLRFNTDRICCYSNLSALDMLGLMLRCDICISGGGQTLYELARVGIPTIGICLAENQKFNLEDLQGQKYIEFAGWYNDRNLLLKLAETLERLMPYQKRIDKSRSMKDYVDGKGVKRILDFLYKRYEAN